MAVSAVGSVPRPPSVLLAALRMAIGFPAWPCLIRFDKVPWACAALWPPDLVGTTATSLDRRRGQAMATAALAVSKAELGLSFFAEAWEYPA